jgi:hypothetical protein
MTVAEGAKYVAAAYAVILAAIVIYCFVSSRRVAALRRDVELLESELRRQAPASGAE